MCRRYFSWHDDFTVISARLILSKTIYILLEVSLKTIMIMKLIHMLFPYVMRISMHTILYHNLYGFLLSKRSYGRLNFILKKDMLVWLRIFQRICQRFDMYD